VHNSLEVQQYLVKAKKGWVRASRVNPAVASLPADEPTAWTATETVESRIRPNRGSFGETPGKLLTLK